MYFPIKYNGHNISMKSPHLEINFVPPYIWKSIITSTIFSVKNVKLLFAMEAYNHFPKLTFLV